MSGTHLANRTTATELARAYQAAAASIRGAFAQIVAAEAAMNAAVTLDGPGYIHVNRHGGRLNFGDPEAVLADCRRDFWRAIVERLELRRMTSPERWRALQREIDDGKMPDVTEENVLSVLTALHAQLPDMLRESVEAVFDWLRPRRSHYKTNSELEVGPKVVIGWVVEQWGPLCTSWRPNYRTEEQLAALDNVFSALDGKGQHTAGHYSSIGTAIRTQGFDGQGDTEYFSFKVYKNGNMHLTFKRADLLARFNAIAGGRRLRPSAEAAE